MRYGRQMIIPEFGLPGQVTLQRSSVAVVGAGGLGCPALQYLACAGVGTLGVFDGDIVELSNLQRQVLHTEARLGMNKAESAAKAIQQINSRIKVNVYPHHLISSDAASLLAAYDAILDCTDNAPTRYLLSDTAVRLRKPLVSGAAQMLEGQLCVYNLDNTGPCYRCLFPKPPPAQAMGSCEETGILGVVTGIIGSMQALETIKILTGRHDGKPVLLIYSALGSPPLRPIKLRSRSPSCIACGSFPSATPESDYVAFCGGPTPNWVSEGLNPGDAGSRITASELGEALRVKPDSTVIDVRPPTEFGICHLPGSTNIPLKDIARIGEAVENRSPKSPIFVVCRLGNDSQVAASKIKELCPDAVVKDVIGGLRSWSKEVDQTFPIY
ncbi:hypothetical protein PUNSTDRAFT_122623 [Punctularia strigosozonata HHB-11173 SS5]|uniref:Needs CLA4 to survive protein 3 n=1 Tax=Punctularia strigosozonata (strain HHB-11173) TaxID=741275 RepID=R7S4W9_PUNST|nr:uncharacterized protein PUNSTDRAFT_122623 [Punctularia strigosozonata HHB-11173 SS5]EIN04934.1 hypothetical protein PUNSTDRAFT_122623 [Punctularia strigosozonata HHB-11173 SS5]